MLLYRAIALRTLLPHSIRHCHKLVDKTDSGVDSATIAQKIDKNPDNYPISFHVDYAELYDNLINSGFTADQAKCVKNILFNQNQSHITATNGLCELKNNLHNIDRKLDLQINTIKKDMVILEKSEFFLLRTDNEVLHHLNVARFLSNVNLENERSTWFNIQGYQNISRMRSNITVEFSLEKAKTREDISKQEQRIKDTNNRIDTEMAKMLKELEQQKSDLIKYILATIISFTMLAMGISRIVSSFI